MNIILSYILLSLNLVNVLLHMLGAYLLISMYPTCRRSLQQIYLINLSISECLTNFLEVCRIISHLIPFKDNHLKIVNGIRYYTLIVSFTGISVVYYLVMIYLTLDRLMDIVLNIKYPVYWSEEKAKYLLITTWLFGLFSCVTVCICYQLFNFNWEDAFFKYFYPPIEFAFIILALTTYGFIFHKYRKNRLDAPGYLDNCTPRRRKNSTIQIFRKSRFYISVLLILTFLLFMIVPDITYLFLAIIYKSKSDILLTCCWISYAISNLADAYIYIFVQDEVRGKLWKMLSSFQRPVNSIINMETTKTRRSGLTNEVYLRNQFDKSRVGSDKVFESIHISNTRLEKKKIVKKVKFLTDPVISPTVDIKEVTSNEHALPISNQWQVVGFTTNSIVSSYNEEYNIGIINETFQTTKLWTNPDSWWIVDFI